MKKLIIENRGLLILSTILILVPQVIAAVMGENIYWIPLQCLALHWFCLLITFWDWRKKPQGKKIVHLVIWICPVMSIVGSSFFLLVKRNQIGGELAMVFLYFGLGLMFLLIGNYLPKIRQNRTMGIKIKWALEDEENWNATHRLGGKVWVACGFACMLCALSPFSGLSIGIFIAAIAGSVIIPTVYSWQFYRKRLQVGEISKTRLSSRRIFMTVALVVFGIWVLFTGNMTIIYQSDGFIIQASGWKDYKVLYDEVDQITYEPDGVPGGKKSRWANGFGNLKMSMGEFYNDTFGYYMVNVMYPMITADCIEYGTYVTGERATGISFSIQTFTTKLGQALAAGIGAFLLEAVGYVPNAQQSATALNGIFSMITLLPAAGMLAMVIIFGKFYKIREKDVQMYIKENEKNE